MAQSTLTQLKTLEAVYASNQDMMEPNPILLAPFFSEKAGLSYESFGSLLQYTREFGPGRYPVQNGKGETFHLVLYEDGSWRIATPQLELFQWIPSDKVREGNQIKVENATKSPHTLT